MVAMSYFCRQNMSQISLEIVVNCSHPSEILVTFILVDFFPIKLDTKKSAWSIVYNGGGGGGLRVIIKKKIYCISFSEDRFCRSTDLEVSSPQMVNMDRLFYVVWQIILCFETISDLVKLSVFSVCI